MLDDHPTGRLLGRFAFDFLSDAHERRVFGLVRVGPRVEANPDPNPNPNPNPRRVFGATRDALRALADFDPELALRWRWCLQVRGSRDH